MWRSPVREKFELPEVRPTKAGELLLTATEYGNWRPDGRKSDAKCWYATTTTDGTTTEPGNAEHDAADDDADDAAASSGRYAANDAARFHRWAVSLAGHSESLGDCFKFI